VEEASEFAFINRQSQDDAPRLPGPAMWGPRHGPVCGQVLVTPHSHCLVVVCEIAAAEWEDVLI